MHFFAPSRVFFGAMILKAGQEYNCRPEFRQVLL